MTSRGLLRASCAAAGLAIGASFSLVDLPEASAQASGDRAVAEALFREARSLMKQGKYADACPKFAESYRLDRAVGTLLNLAVCHEREGRLAAAWAEYNDAVVEAKREGQRERAQLAQQRANELEAKLARIKIDVPDSVAVLDGFELKLDGRPISRAVWTSAVPLDPGEHDVEASAARHQTWRHTFQVGAKAETMTVSVPELEPEAPAEPEPAPTPVQVEPAPAPASAAAQPSDGSGQRLVGIVLGAGGIVGLGVGSYFGLSAMSLKSDRDEHCESGNACTQEGVDLDSDARGAATVSTIGFIAGGALLAAGVVVYLTAPSAVEQATVQLGPTVSHRGGGLQVWGSF